MTKQDEQIVIDPVSARGAVKTGRVRYILGVSIALAVFGMALIWMFFA